MMKFRVALLMGFTLVLPLCADEGMWLFNQPPLARVRERHGFEITDAWLERVKKSSVHFGGGSGSLVSRDGLLFSNHHVAAGTLHKLGTPATNYLRDGFLARTPGEEIKCPDLAVEVLESIEDVTAQVNAAVAADADPGAAYTARRNAIAGIEKDSASATGLRSRVITLWQGGAYHLYRSRQFSDVRLVFAPEQSIGAFGGDVDNFEYPRQDLDIAFFRVYENGKPARVKDFLPFNPAGPAEGDLVFASGHPGSTERLLTVAELRDVRDRELPARLLSLKRQEVLLIAWSARSEENARRARQLLAGVQNSRKVRDGCLAEMLDPAFMQARENAEMGFRSRLEEKPEFAPALEAYNRIRRATRALAGQSLRAGFLEGREGFRCESFEFARTLLRAGDELPKPNGQRLPEFSDSSLDSLERSLFSSKPVYADLETLRLADSLTQLVIQLGAEDELVRKILSGMSPQARAAGLIRDTKVRDVRFRRKLYSGGAVAVSAAQDPMIELARLVDVESRALRRTADGLHEVRRQSHAAIAGARNRLLGCTNYPDATGSLRLSYGVVKGYEDAGRVLPAFTTLGSVFEKADAMRQREPFNLPESWLKHRAALNKGVPFNFATTCDIVGGNSGSPVVNRAGECVGIIFDGNLQSLAWDVAYSDSQARGLAVHSAAVMEALTRVYGATELARELMEGGLSGVGN